MLVLTRHRNESIVIAGCITVTIVEVRGDKVRLGVTAPPAVRVDRQEVHEARQESEEPDPDAESLKW